MNRKLPAALLALLLPAAAQANCLAMTIKPGEEGLVLLCLALVVLVVGALGLAVLAVVVSMAQAVVALPGTALRSLAPPPAA